MPDPKDNAKLTGDTHPPELENTGHAAADDTEIDETPGRGGNPDGSRKDREGAGTDRRSEDKA